MDRGTRLNFCLQYCSPEIQAIRQRSPYYYWLYQDDDDGDRYEAHRLYVNRMDATANEYKCDCKQSK